MISSLKERPEVSPKISQAASRIGSQLFSNRFISGRRDRRFKKFLRETHSYLSKAEAARFYVPYFALAPAGSRFKGYATPASDFDILIIGGDGTYVGENHLGTCAQSFVEKNYAQKGPFVVHYLDPNFFEANFRTPTPTPNYVYSHAVWYLLHPFCGQLSVIRRLRHLAKLKHREYLERWPEVALKNLRETVSAMLFWEWGLHVNVDERGNCTLDPERNAHRMERNPGETLKKLFAQGFDLDSITRMIESRGCLWWNRAVKILGHPIKS